MVEKIEDIVRKTDCRQLQDTPTRMEELGMEAFDDLDEETQGMLLEVGRFDCLWICWDFRYEIVEFFREW